MSYVSAKIGLISLVKYITEVYSQAKEFLTPVC